MKKFIVRTLTGTAYVSVIIGSILGGRYIFSALFSLVLIFSLNEFYRLCRKGSFKPQVIPGIIFSLIIYVLMFLTSQQYIEKTFLLTLIPLFIIIPIIEIFRESKNPVQNIAVTIFGAVYFAFPYSVFNSILIPYANQPELYKPELLIGMMVIIWSSDTGAYIFGSLFGKHKLAERISPHKTWEGTIGGAILGSLVAILFFSYFSYFSTIQIVLISLSTIIAGTFGDLAESMVKRNFKAKDSGRLLPGHGGLFDRFDSMLFAAPVYYVFIFLILN